METGNMIWTICKRKWTTDADSLKWNNYNSFYSERGEREEGYEKATQGTLVVTGLFSILTLVVNTWTYSGTKIV